MVSSTVGLRVLLIQKESKPPNLINEITVKFESLVNTERIKTLREVVKPFFVFESLVNTERIKTVSRFVFPVHVFESLVNTERIKTYPPPTLTLRGFERLVNRKL